MQRNESPHTKSKRLAVCAMLSALGVTVLYLGSLLELLDLCTAALAAMLIIPVMIEYGGIYPWGIYSVTSLLALALLPSKLVAAVYLLFGYYPIVKAYLERLRPLVARLLKQALYLAVIAAVYLASLLLTGVLQMPLWYHAALVALALVTLNVFDLALTRLISLYVLKYRSRIGKWMK